MMNRQRTISLTFLLLVPALLHAQPKEVIDAYHLNQAIVKKDVDKLKELISEGCDVNYQYNGRNALHTACDNNSVEMAALIMEAGADPNSISEEGQGRTPLQYAAGDMMEDLPELIELLLSNGADPDLSLNPDQAPLFVAINRAHVGSVRVLLAYGASTQLNNSMGQTPLDHVDYLIERGVSDAKTQADLKAIKALLNP
jgi:ankyrin repeat protein